MSLQVSEVLRNQYKIIRLVGRGGYSDVYLAEDMNSKTHVAIKELSIYCTEKEEREELEIQIILEISMLQQLQHPNLPRLEAYFEQENRFYLVMEFIEGEDLVSHYKNNPNYWGVDTVLRLAMELCSMFEYIHGQNPPIIFKDLKPQNILILKSGSIKLIDFGISKYYGSKTMPAARAITPNFSSPEQYAATGTDMRSDIYSLGATLYFMLTGQEPMDAIKRMLSPGTFEGPRSINPCIPEEIDGIIFKAMEFKSENRYQSVTEMKADLAKLLQEDENGNIPKYEDRAVFKTEESFITDDMDTNMDIPSQHLISFDTITLPMEEDFFNEEDKQKEEKREKIKEDKKQKNKKEDKKQKNKKEDKKEDKKENKKEDKKEDEREDKKEVKKLKKKKEKSHFSPVRVLFGILIGLIIIVLLLLGVDWSIIKIFDL